MSFTSQSHLGIFSNVIYKSEKFYLSDGKNFCTYYLCLTQKKAVINDSKFYVNKKLF